MSKHSILHEKHKELKAKMVSFGDWLMPVSYTSVLAEHHTVREKSGLFDVSHMGEIIVTGENSKNFLQKTTINDIERLSLNSGQYTAMCNHKGGVIDDLIIYKLAENNFLLVVNASNTEKDFNWLQEQAKHFDNVALQDVSSEWAQVALQGPMSSEVFKKILPEKVSAKLDSLKYMELIDASSDLGYKILIARTGYTGEKGFEVYVCPEHSGSLWDKMLATTGETGVIPVGLGARDTLRLEACYLLYGNDMNDEITPLEAGIGWATKLDTGFIGSEALRVQKEHGPTKKCYAFKMIDTAIPRQGMTIYSPAGSKLGVVTSGSVLPTVGGSGGLSMISSDSKVGDNIEIDIRGKRKLAQLVKRPLYSAKIKN